MTEFVATKHILEAALLASGEALTIDELRALFDSDPGSDIIASALTELQHDWAGRAVELVCVADGWRFRTKPVVQSYLDRLFGGAPRPLGRAALEVLAIIAVQGPVTRGEIASVRGVEVSPQVLKNLEAQGWIEVVGHRDGPGRPALLDITDRLLADLGLKDRQSLVQALNHKPRDRIS